MQTQQKNSISQKQEISWHAKLTSDYGHMYVMLFPRHLQSATKLVETICHRGPLLHFASLEKLKLNFPHPLHTMSCHCSRKRKQPNIEWRGGEGGGAKMWIVLFFEVTSFECNVLFSSVKLFHSRTICACHWLYLKPWQDYKPTGSLTSLSHCCLLLHNF